jgi:hypothetical protein
LSKKDYKRIRYYETKKTVHEAELMELITKRKEIPSGHSRHLHRINMQIGRLRKQITSYERLIDEVKQAV